MVAIRAIDGTVQVPMEPVSPPAAVSDRQSPASSGKTLPPAAEDAHPERAATVVQLAGDVERYVQSLQRRLQFSIDDESGRTVIRVIDRETEQVIRQIPGDEMLALSKRLRATAGLLLREQA